MKHLYFLFSIVFTLLFSGGFAQRAVPVITASSFLLAARLPLAAGETNVKTQPAIVNTVQAYTIKVSNARRNAAADANLSITITYI